MNRGTVSFLLAMALLLVIGVTWSKTGGFAQAYQERNAREWADFGFQFASTTECQACHKNTATTWAGAQHKTVNCQNCHGPATAHIQGEGKPYVDKSRAACGYCHNKITGRRADFPVVDLEKHNTGQSSCTACHNPHAPGLGRSGGK